MPTWLIIIIVVALIGAIIGYLTSKGDRVEDAIQGGCVSAGGCGYLLLQLFLWGLGIAFLIWLFGAIFG